MVERLFLAVPRGCLQFVIVVFPDHTHLLFLKKLVESRGLSRSLPGKALKTLVESRGMPRSLPGKTLKTLFESRGMLRSLPGKALETLVESRSLPSDLTCVLKALVSKDTNLVFYLSVHLR